MTICDVWIKYALLVCIEHCMSRLMKWYIADFQHMINQWRLLENVAHLVIDRGQCWRCFCIEKADNMGTSQLFCIRCDCPWKTEPWDASASEKPNIFPFPALIESVMVPQLLLLLLHKRFEKWKYWKESGERKKALFLFMWWALSRASGPCHYGSVPALLIPTPLKWPI